MAVESRSSSDLFALFGLPASFELDRGSLERAYLERARDAHPDRFAAAPAAERAAAVGRAMELNQAYKTLRDPVRRAEYLLGRAGVTIGGNEQIDAGFLAEVLDLREELAEARAAGRTADVARLEGAMKARRKALIAVLGPALAGGALDDAKRALIELRYVARYLDECEAALDEDAA